MALISCVVTHLICVFIFAYAKSRFSHEVAQLPTSHMLVHLCFPDIYY